jgi:hypothetical protein
METAELLRWVSTHEELELSESACGKFASAEKARMEFARVGDNFFAYPGGLFDDIRTVSEALTAIHSGICMGQIFGGKLRPDHSLAMYYELAGGERAKAEKRPDMSTEPELRSGSGDQPFHRAEVSLEEALRFLRREELTDLSPLAEGFNLITHSGAPLGWVKRISTRANNLYPKSLAITKQI